MRLLSVEWIGLYVFWVPRLNKDRVGSGYSIELDMHPYGACYHDLTERLSTGVMEFLQVRGIHCVIVGGLATEYCVKTTALQLRRAGFDVVVNLAACRGLDPIAIQAAIKEMKALGIAFVVTASEFMLP